MGHQVSKTEKTFKKFPNDWELVSLNKIIAKEKNSIKRGPWGSSLKKEFFVKKGFKVYEQQNAIKGNHTAGEYFIDESKFQELKNFEVKYLDFIISCSGTIGKIYQIPKDAMPGIINQALLKITLDSKKIDYNFFKYIFQSPYVQNKFTETAHGSAIKNVISLKEIKKIYLKIPPKNEQKKISSILSNVDNLIQNTSHVLEQTYRLKKGLMLALLRKGIGHSKFKKINWYYRKEIEIPEKWSLRKLGDVCEILDSKRVPLKQSDRKKMKGPIPYYGASGVIDYINDYIFDERLLCLAEDGENLRSRVLPVAFTIQGKTWVNNHAHVLKPNKIVELEYLEYYLNQINYLQHLDFTAQPKLNQTELKKIKILCPPLPEQKQIINILSNIDSKTQILKIYKSNLESLKKGLFQKLLTGNIRVKF